jgi:hypothetical protein
MKKLYLGCLFTFLASYAFAQQEKITFEVYFDFNKAAVRADSKAKIDSVMAATKERRIFTRVTGHTCDIGTDPYNMDLSEKRARAAFEYAKSLGEQETKLELFFYGEKDPKYPNDRAGRPINRRVEITFTLEDDDRDTVVRDGCAEVFIEKGTYKPNKNKEITFQVKNLGDAKKMKSEGITINDKNGKKLYFSGIMQYSASFNANELTAGKNVRVKVPAVGEAKPGYTLYMGEKNSEGKIVWAPTGRPCEPKETSANCKTYDFEMPLNGYCACAKPRECDEDCNENPFGGEEAPDLNAADIRASGDGVAVKFPDGAYPKALGSLDVKVIDDKKFEEDLDICEQFSFAVVTEDWFPSFNNIKHIQNLIVTAKDGSNAINSDPNKQQRIYVPKDKMKGMTKPVIVPGIRQTKGYVKWDMAKYEPVTCLGSVNCKYMVFDVPGTGNYKLGDWIEGPAIKKEDKYVLKTRVLKDNVVYVGNKKTNYVYKAKMNKRNGKDRDKEYVLFDFEKMGGSAGDIVILVKHEKANGKKFYEEALLSELIFKKAKNMYIMRRKDFDKVDDFNNAELKKCK